MRRLSGNSFSNITYDDVLYLWRRFIGGQWEYKNFLADFFWNSVQVLCDYKYQFVLIVLQFE